MNADARQGLDRTELSVVILTFNEGKHIRRALRSIATLNARVFIVDSFSTDETCEIAAEFGAFVVKHKFVNYALQFQWALDTLPIDTPWVMRLDADEVMTPELVEEIRARLPSLGPELTGVILKRRHVFLGRWIRHGGRYPLLLLRIWRRGDARIEQRWMDEHMILLKGASVVFEHDFADESLEDLTFFINKHNKYATREAIDQLVSKYGLAPMDQAIFTQQAYEQAARKRFMKERLYNRLPFWLGPFGYFILRYLFQAGFLDGAPGLVYHTLQGFWYRFLIGAKVWDYDRTLRQLPDANARLRALERLTGHALGGQTGGVSTTVTDAAVAPSGGGIVRS